MESKQVALITGASSGIGKETATLLHTYGYKVYGAARRLDEMKDLEIKGITTLPLDITDEQSATSCVNQIIKTEGRIDILVNNAGYGSYGAIEDVKLEEARRQFDVNIFGLARITQLVLPYMRQHKYGKIVNISSMAGKIYTPFGGWYHATKHALEGLSDCLRLETKSFGIDVIIIEPGGIKTNWGLIAADNLRKASARGAYSQSTDKTAENMTEMYRSNKLSDVSVIAKTILKAIKASKPRTRYAVGYMSKLSIFVRTYFGDRIFDRVIKMIL
ncbi:MAG: oxidoreductase [Paludibacteraceae bacterium]